MLSDTTNNVSLSSIADNHNLLHGGQYILMSIKEHQGDIMFAGSCHIWINRSLIAIRMNIECLPLLRMSSIVYYKN